MILGTHIPIDHNFNLMAAFVKKHQMGICQIIYPDRAVEYNLWKGHTWTQYCPDTRLMVHAPFYMNFVAEGIKGRSALGMLRGLYEKAAAFQANYIVAHCGSGPSAMPLMYVSDLAHQKMPNVRFLLENDAGSKGGTKVGSIKNLVALRAGLGKDANGKWKMGICIDTAHAYANDEDHWFDHMDNLQPDVIHLNDPDSNVVRGGHLDRHDSIFGTGKLGLQRIMKVVHWANTNNVPMIIENKSTENAIRSMEIVRAQLGGQLGTDSVAEVSPIQF